MSTDLLEPTGPNEAIRLRPTVYRPAPDAHPHRMRREADGAVYGWVRMEPVTAPEPHQAPAVHVTLGQVQDAGPNESPPGTISDLEGYDERPDPLQARTPGQFVQAMREFRAWAGDPSFRDLEARTGGNVSRTAFHTALRGPDLPKMLVVSSFIGACGGDREEVRRWTTAWRRLRKAQQGEHETTEETILRLLTDQD
ncbi:hypothetical protein [Nocardiopsis halophila]|uniref:hypothetical protein n=1 Tax=Nocardiopsis halophila TaxID=141692 RepID=UPI00034DE8D0|nr:hypothetical protein [Nocardiopsis halophila]